MITSVTRLAASALLASVLLSGPAPASAAHLACKQHSTFGVGRGPAFGIAMDHAIQNWRVRTSSTLGAAYGNYYNALNYGRQQDGRAHLLQGLGQPLPMILET